MKRSGTKHKRTTGPPKVGHRAHDLLADRLPPPVTALRATSPQLPGIPRPRCGPVLLQTPRQTDHVGHGVSLVLSRVELANDVRESVGCFDLERYVVSKRKPRCARHWRSHATPNRDCGRAAGSRQRCPATRTHLADDEVDRLVRRAGNRSSVRGTKSGEDHGARTAHHAEERTVDRRQVLSAGCYRSVRRG
jgi:hypothetical protein